MIENDIKLLEHCVLDLQHRVQVLEKKLKQTQRQVSVLECKVDRKTEPQTCDTCRYSYITCRFMDKGEPCHYEPKTEPQTEYNEYREKIRMHDPHRDW